MSGHFIKSSVNVIVIRDGKVLLSRRANTGWMDGYLCAPGGHVEEGESPSRAILREIREELGVDVDPLHIEFACVAARNASPVQYVAYEFVLRDNGYDFLNAEPDRCSELVWVELANLPDDLIPDFRQILEHGIIGGKKYLEVGFD